LPYSLTKPTLIYVPRSRKVDDPVSRQLMALADPTRRTVYEIVRTRPSSVAAVTGELSISQPAVSQHLKVLALAGLVTVTPDGARRIYRAEGRGLTPLRAWVDGLWDGASP
jgi:DNA-binding transcriptional ArsR family regulator